MMKVSHPSFLAFCYGQSQPLKLLLHRSAWEQTLETLLRDSRWRELLDRHTERETALAQRQDEQQSERTLVQSMDEFVMRNQLADEYDQKKIFNVKRARELSKASRTNAKR